LPVGGCNQKFFGSGLGELFIFLLSFSFYKCVTFLGTKRLAIAFCISACDIYAISITIDEFS